MQVFHYAMCAAVIVGGLRWILTVKFQDRTNEKETLAWNSVIACVLLAICIRFFILIVFARTDFFATEGDEIVRWIISRNWSRNPFLFTTWDGVWLTGDFIYYGSLMNLFDNPLIALQVGNCIAQVIGIVGVAYAGFVVGRSKCAAATSALLVSVGYPYVWLGYGAMAEVPMASMLVFSVALLIQFLECVPEKPWNKLLLAIAAGICLFALTSLHYLAWIAILTGIPLFLGALFLRRRHLGPAGWVGLLFIALGIGLFPFFWMVASYYFLGDPIQFYTNTIAMNARDAASEPNPGRAFFWVYPNLYWNQAAPIALLALASLCPFLPGGNIHRRYGLGIFVFLLLLIFAIRAEVTGFSPVRHRFVILPYTLTFPLAGAALADIWSLIHRQRRYVGPRRILIFLLPAGAAFALWGAHNRKECFRYTELSASKFWPHDGPIMGHWLQREFNNPQILSFEEAMGPIGVHEINPTGIIWNIMAYAAGSPDRFEPIPPESWPRQISPKLRIIITNDEIEPPGFKRIATFGQWRVLRRS